MWGHNSEVSALFSPLIHHPNCASHAPVQRASPSPSIENNTPVFSRMEEGYWLLGWEWDLRSTDVEPIPQFITPFIPPFPKITESTNSQTFWELWAAGLIVSILPRIQLRIQLSHICKVSCYLSFYFPDFRILCVSPCCHWVAWRRASLMSSGFSSNLNLPHHSQGRHCFWWWKGH